MCNAPRVHPSIIRCGTPRYGSWTAHAYDQVVECHVACGQRKEALRLAAEGVSEFVALQDKRSEALALRTLSYAHFSCDEYPSPTFSNFIFVLKCTICKFVFYILYMLWAIPVNLVSVFDKSIMFLRVHA